MSDSEMDAVVAGDGFSDADRVAHQMASKFGQHAADYQEPSAHASALHEKFVRSLKP